MRPIVLDSEGSLRFKRNVLVRRLLDESTKRGYGLNELLADDPQEDIDELYQLIGYSVGGYCDLAASDVVSNASADVAEEEAKNVLCVSKLNKI